MSEFQNGIIEQGTDFVIEIAKLQNCEIAKLRNYTMITEKGNWKNIGILQFRVRILLLRDFFCVRASGGMLFAIKGNSMIYKRIFQEKSRKSSNFALLGKFGREKAPGFPPSRE